MDAPPVRLASLKAAGFQLATPFQLTLPDGRLLQCEQLLRLLPGKRLVLRATLPDQTPVLAKLFFDRRHNDRERAGYHRLAAAGIRTPACQLSEALDDGAVCLYDFIRDAETMAERWQAAAPAARPPLFSALLDVLADLYRQGIVQTDLHLSNFLWQGDVLYALDPASCDISSPRHTVGDNLALLLAQLPRADWAWAAAAIQARFGPLAPVNLPAAADQQWRKRRDDYLQKMNRDCTDIADLSHGALHILCQRDLLTPALQAALENPAQLVDPQRLLKAGNSATVSLRDIDGRTLVVKRYTDKDLWRRLRRAWRPSRAARGWRFAHAFAFAGIAVPRPIALVEQRNGLLSRTGWLVMEYIAGTSLLDHWQHALPSARQLDDIRDLFLGLRASRLCHGDLKATNILCRGDQLYLIDFDGSREFHCPRRLARALARDRERFLRNWDNPDLCATLRAVTAP